MSYARCCRPIPDDPIIAYLSAGRGIVIHRETCGNVEDYHKHPEKWQPVAWQKDINRYFSAEIRCEAQNKIGMLASLSAAIAGTSTNIGDANVEVKDGDVSLFRFEVEVKDPQAAGQCCAYHYRQMPEVLRVSRYQAFTPEQRRMSRSVITTPKAPAAIGPYSQAVKTGNLVFMSGQIPLDPAHRPAGERRDRSRDHARVREPQGRGRSRGRFAGRCGEGEHLPHRPRALRQGQ